jgi:hypothetical protein
VGAKSEQYCVIEGGSLQVRIVSSYEYKSI